MIVKNEREQWIGCNICEELVELRRKTLAHPETVLLMMEELARDHATCEQYKHDPRMAKMQRAYVVGMRRETERAAPGRHTRSARCAATA
jgi:hypothetical protein